MKITSFIRFMSVLCLMGVQANAQIFPSYTWTPGQPADPTPGFVVYGGNTYNAIISGSDPYGGTSPLWQVSAQGASQYPGFGANNLTLSPTKTYRFSIWVKQVNSLSPSVSLYLTSAQNDGLKDGSGALVKNYDITPTGWRVPVLGKWYLLVGYLKANGEEDSFTGGIYEYETDPAISFAPLNFSTHELQGNITTFNFRPYIMNSDNIEDKVYFFDPRIDEVANDDVSDLIFPGNPPEPVPGDSVWDATGNDIHYTAGNVGIGTIDPGDWKLAVNGKVRAKEVKVETANWPDYVFAMDYALPTLEEVSRHIDEEGRLINIPSAEEMESNGIELGEMNRLLLEKIEELTLYILEQEKTIRQMSVVQKDLDELKEKVKVLLN